MKDRKEHWPSFARRLRKEALAEIEGGRYPKKQVESALRIPDPYSRTLALGSMFRDLSQAGMDAESVWSSAVESAEGIEPEWKREELLEKLASWGMKCGKDVLSFPDMLSDRELCMKLLSKLVRISDDRARERLWELWSGRPEKDRYQLLRMMVHSGFPHDRAMEMAAELSEERVQMLGKYIERGGKRDDKKAKETEVPALSGPAPEFTMALYNTYRGKAGDIHFRSIARASALCYAFDLNLALVGFPFESEEECVERVLSSTRVGDGSEYLRALHRAGRFSLHRDLGSIEGTLVATTPEPMPEKEMRPEDIREGMVFLVGLGHEGLPARALKRAEKHLEFTGKKASLETCTAMGVLAHMIYSLRNPYISPR